MKTHKGISLLALSAVFFLAFAWIQCGCVHAAPPEKSSMPCHQESSSGKTAEDDCCASSCGLERTKVSKKFELLQSAGSLSFRLFDLPFSFSAVLPVVVNKQDQYIASTGDPSPQPRFLLFRSLLI